MKTFYTLSTAILVNLYVRHYNDGIALRDGFAEQE